MSRSSKPKPTGGQDSAQPTAAREASDEGNGASSSSKSERIDKPHPVEDRRRSPWRKRNGEINMRAITAAGIVVTAILTIGSVAFNIVYTQSAITNIGVQQNPTEESQTTVTGDINIYQSTSGAPGEADPADSSSPDPCAKEPGIAVKAGWGPDRPSYTEEQGAPYTALNAIRNNPYLGDERGFMGIRDSEDPPYSVWHYSIEVERDRLYRIRIYVHNSVNGEGLDLAAVETRLSVSLPTCTGYAIPANGFLESKTAYPMEIWGGVTMWSDEYFNLAYVEDSAIFETDAHIGDPVKMSEDFLTSKGVLLGYDEMDGSILPGYEYDGYFSFLVRPQFAPEE